MSRSTPPPGPHALALGTHHHRLTILAVEVVQMRGQRRRVYTCRCDCGTVFTARAQNVHYGNTRSCGCLRNELSCERVLARWQGRKEVRHGE